MQDDTNDPNGGSGDDQVTDRDRQLESGGFWESPSDPPGDDTTKRSAEPSDQVTDRDRVLESGGFWEAPVDPAEDPPASS